MAGARAVLYDLGANSWGSSLGWLLEHYPIRFDRAFGWEPNAAFLRGTGGVPSSHRHMATVFQARAAVEWAPLQACAQAIAAAGGPGRLRAPRSDCSQFDFPEFLGATARREDFVVVKIDCEGLEWAILDQLLERGLAHLVDEMFVEFHYDRELPAGTADGWAPAARRSYPGRTFYKADAERYMRQWRELVPAFHLWA